MDSNDNELNKMTILCPSCPSKIMNPETGKYLKEERVSIHTDITPSPTP